MPSVRKVLIVGGGMVGNTLAVLLGRGGVEVHLVEIDPDWSVLGSGITLQGNALRVLREAGVWDRVVANMGASPNANPTRPGLGGPDVPPMAGMYRPKLQEILIDAVRAVRTRVRLGCTVRRLRQNTDGVRVHFTDGTTDVYDLVVGADGLRSRTRDLVGMDVVTRDVDMAAWRVTAKRPASLKQMETRFGGPCYMAGINPTGDDQLYIFLMVDADDGAGMARADMPTRVRELVAGYGGVWADVAQEIDDPDRIDYRTFKYLLVDRPWNRGRVVVIGDAAHACPPTIGQGAAMGLEDSLVLAELLLGSEALDQALFDAFMDRRYTRVRTVVETSVAICAALKLPNGGEAADQLMAHVIQSLYQPA